MGKSLKFYDLKGKRAFRTSNYTIVKKRNKKHGGYTIMAKAKAPSGITVYRILKRTKR